MEEEILNRRWKNVDKLLAKYSKDYKKLNRKTQDKLQDVFNLIKISYQDINKPISKQEKARLDRFILELQESGLLNDYYGYKARLMLNKKKVTYSEMLEIMIEGCYIDENSKLDEINNQYYYEIADNAYSQGIREANILKPIHFHIPFETMYLLLNIPLLNATAKAYLKALELNNAEELYKRALMILQQGNSVDINSKEMQELFKKQQNRIISIREVGQPTGAISNITDNLVNDAYLQVAKDNDIQKVRFVAEMDERTTRMCKNMNGMIFNVQAENKFKRYFGYDAKHLYYKTITCYGMVKGLNMPPIDNHFHWCRSTLTYLLEKTSRKDYNIVNQEKFVKANGQYVEHINMKDIEKKLKEYEKDIVNEPIENMFVILPNGDVYRFSATDNNVKADGINLHGAVVTHNHPEAQTQYSLSSLDRIDFYKNEISRYRGIDKKYVYEINNNPEFKEEMPNLDTIYEDDPKSFHRDNIMYSYTYKIGYKRWKNE